MLCSVCVVTNCESATVSLTSQSQPGEYHESLPTDVVSEGVRSVVDWRERWQQGHRSGDRHRSRNKVQVRQNNVNNVRQQLTFEGGVCGMLDLREVS